MTANGPRSGPEAGGASAPAFSDRRLSRDELERLSAGIVRTMQSKYVPGRDRVITPDNVFQPAVGEGRDDLEAFQLKLFLPGSRVEGLDNLDRCLADMERGRRIVFLPEHRGNLDVPSFHALLKREDPRYRRILDKLVFIAGRKLNEASDFMKMFTEKYSRLIVVPRRDFPVPEPEEPPEARRRRKAFEREASRINRAAFRAMERLKRAGHIFVLYPTGGRILPGHSNRGVREVTSYLRTFDVAYLISMEGNTLPPRSRMEDERPVQEKVVYRVGPPLETEAFLERMRAEFDERAVAGEGEAPSHVHGADYDQYVVDRIMEMLTRLRTEGRYE